MYKSLILLYFVKNINCHLILKHPNVWGVKDSYSLEQPLDNTNNNWICAGRNPDNNNIIELTAGRSYDFNISCGEKDLNAPGCLVGDWHAGNNVDDYAGCVLGVNYNNYKNASNYFYMSHSKECAKRESPSSFYISRNVRNCEKCVCSWAWAPSRKYSSPAQFYHNCFYCKITNGIGTRKTMKKHEFINVKNSRYNDVTYNDILKTLR
jgi:hypothetical protein